MSGKQTPSVEGMEELIPTKEALKSLKSDVNYETAIAELVDNSLDQWLRNSSGEASLLVEVLAENDDDEDRTELIVRDNAGGVPRSDAKVVFTLGDSRERDGKPYIGSYGLGAKKALMNLGLPFTIASRHEDAEVGWAYTITEDWFDDDTDWSVEIRKEESLDPGVTELRVHDLDYDWFDDEADDEDDDEDKLSTAERLREAFGRTYNLFLADGLGGEDHDVTIEVQGEAVEPLGTPEYSFTPVDDMYPRRFENITVERGDWAKTDVTITIGLLREGDSETAGIDVYMQGRQVLHAARDERVGFGTNLDRFDPQHDTRFKAIVELETNDDGRDLPWDTQKSNVDPYNPIMEEVRDWIKRTTQDYLFLDDGKVPKGIVYPYPASYPEAANGGEIAVHDFSNQQRVTSPYRPGTNRDELDELVAIARAHAVMRFRCEDAVDDDHVPAYQYLVAAELDDLEYSDLEELAVAPVDFARDDADALAEQLERLAKVHAEAGVRYDADLPIWQQPKYRDALPEKAQAQGLGVDELDAPEELSDDLPATIDELGPVGGGLDGEDDALGEDDEEAGEEEDDEMVQVALRVIHGAEGVEAPLQEMARSDALEALNLDDDASDEELFEELERRVRIMMEI